MARPEPTWSDPPRGVAVFGSAELTEGDEGWGRARELGFRVAQAGVPIVTGGYGGVMEAASRGARDAGGEAIGVTCSIFRGRSPNPHLDLEIEEPDLAARTGRLIELSRGFVVLEGKAGTLAELAMLWAYSRAGVLPGPIVIWDDSWADLVRALRASGRLDPRTARPVFLAHDAESAVSSALGAAGSA